MIGQTNLVKSLEIESIEEFAEFVEAAKLDQKFDLRWPWILILYEIVFYDVNYSDAGRPFSKSKEEIHGKIKALKKHWEKYKATRAN